MKADRHNKGQLLCREVDAVEKGNLGWTKAFLSCEDSKGSRQPFVAGEHS